MSHTVLVVAIDPTALPDAGWSPPGAPQLDHATLRAGSAASAARLADLGIGTEVCFVDPTSLDDTQVRRELTSRRYDIVLIGAGLRMDPALTPLFEVLVNAVRETAPHAVLVFNTDPASSAAAVERWLPRGPS